MNKLDAYLKRTGTTHKQFGERLDPPVSQSQVSKWATNRMKMSMYYAAEIERATDGQVPLMSWVDG